MKTSKFYTMAVLFIAMTVITSSCRKDLDCSTDPKLAPHFNEGVEQARAENVADYEAGKKHGLNDFTETDGYNKGYAAGYDKGYHSENGYPKGYAETYPSGLAAGALDVNATNAGVHDGDASGCFDGTKKGKTDGYKKGYDDGYYLGTAAVNSGAILCPSAAGKRYKQKDYDSCKALGYQKNRNFGEYDRGVTEGLAQNAPYQTGYANGYPAGIAPGTAKGYADGKVAGYNAGHKAGEEQAYVNAYNAAYTQGYNRCYNTGYNDKTYGYGTFPSAGNYTNGSGGAGAGFKDGVLDRCAASAGGSGKSGKKEWGTSDGWMTGFGPSSQGAVERYGTLPSTNIAISRGGRYDDALVSRINSDASNKSHSLGKNKLKENAGWLTEIFLR